MHNSEALLTNILLAFHRLVPEPQHRIPLTIYNAHNLLIPFFPILLQAYLVRRPNTHLWRIMVMPVVVLVTMRTYFTYYWIQPSLNVYNWAAALLAITIIARGIEYSGIPKGRLKAGEEYPGKLITPAIEKQEKPTQNGHHLPNGNGEVTTRPQIDDGTTSFAFYQGFKDALEVLCAMRGVGWDFGADLYIAPTPTSLSSMFSSFVKFFFVLDFLESILKLWPPFSTPAGGSYFDPSLPPFQRYAVSTFLHFLTGTCFIAGFEMVYALVGMLCVILFRHKPSSWPPLFDSPWAATSLHDFWSKRWHQILRQTFLVFGGYPLGFLLQPLGRMASHFGLVIGTFLASGLFHNLSIYAMGKGTSREITIFFLGQGIGLCLERVWRTITGRRVGGIWGLLWVYACIVGAGQPCIDTWHQRGLAGGLIIPPQLSPTRQILFPLLAHLISTQS